MSYILEVLKQSERQRHQDQPPPTLLQWQQAEVPAPPAKASRLPWLLGALLILALAALALTYWPTLSSLLPAKPQSQPQAQVEAPPQPRQQPEASKPDLLALTGSQDPDQLAQVVKMQPPQFDPAQEQTMLAQGMEAQVVIEDGQTSPQRVQAETAPDPQPVKPEPEATPPVTLAQTEPVAKSPQAPSSPPPQSQGETQRDPQATAPVTQTDPPLTEPPADQAEQVMDWRKLPVDVQRQLPALQFSVHIYTQEPGDRRVKINGRMRQEGQRITPDLTLEAITPKGVIFRFQDHRFSMKAI